MRGSSLSIAVALLTLASACDRKDGDGRDTVAAAANAGATTAAVTPNDTSRVSAAVPTAGPAPTPSADDPEIVRRAMEFRLTDENVAQFVRASEALALVRARDPQARTLLEAQKRSENPAEGRRGGTLEALEGNAAIAGALTGAGIKVRDYLVMAVAIASAQRFAANPAEAPPTAVSRDNAAYAQANRAKLAQLRVWGE
jgi:hypothetical protein